MSTRTRVVLAGLVLGFQAAALHAQPAHTGAQPAPVEAIRANQNTVPAGRLNSGVLDLRLEAREGMWRPQADDGGGVVVQAFGEAGGPLQLPGPLVRVRAGTRVNVELRNTLAEPLVVYGMHTRPGRAGDTLHVDVGAVRTVSFTAGEPGTYYYWGSTTGLGMEDRVGDDSQLNGAFIIDPAEGPVSDDRVFVLGLWFQEADSTGAEPHDEREIMVINGKSWPDTERLTYTVGDEVRWRWINPTASSHPMHLHGFYFRVDERGDWASRAAVPEADRNLIVTDLMLPGATMDIEWTPEREGNWLFHCHFAFHVSDELHLAPGPSLMAHAQGEPGTHGGAAGAHGAGIGGNGAGVVHAHSMAGLVLGIHVLPGTAAAPAMVPAAARRLRLLVDERAPFGERPGLHLRYTLDEDGAEPDPTAGSEPGAPTLVLRRGQPVAITVVNRLAEPTSVHWHGIELESFPDGVPGWSGTPARIMPAIAPQDSFVAEFVPPRAGTFIYHSHANELNQILGGLAGPLVVLDGTDAMDAERDLVFIVTGSGAAPGDLPFGLVNGRRELAPLDLTAGVTYRLRLINIGDWRTFFTLLDERGFAPATMVAKDGADVVRPRTGPLNLLTGPGETADFEFTPGPGTYRLEFKQQLAGWIIPLEIRAAP